MVLLEILVHQQCSYEQKKCQAVKRARKSQLFSSPVRGPTPVTSPLWVDLDTSFQLQHTSLLPLPDFSPISFLWQLLVEVGNGGMHSGLTQATRLDMLCKLRNAPGDRYTDVSIRK